MRRKTILALVVLNLILGAALAAGPAPTQIIPLGLWDCCESLGTDDLSAYCCENCCWFTSNCHHDDDCAVIEAEAPGT